MEAAFVSEMSISGSGGWRCDVALPQSILIPAPGAADQSSRGHLHGQLCIGVGENEELCAA